ATFRLISTGQEWILLTARSFHVRYSTTLLSMGFSVASGGAGALCAPAPGRLLAICNPLRRICGGQRLHSGGGASRCGTASRRVSGFRTQIADPSFRNTNHRQSICRELRGTGRTLSGTEAVRKGARSV